MIAPVSNYSSHNDYKKPIDEIKNINFSKDLSKGKAGQADGEVLKLDVKEDELVTNRKVPPKIKNFIPRSWTIGGEYADSWNDHIDSTLAASKARGLSYYEHEKFINDSSYKWVENLRKNDPEMFTYHLTKHKENIMKGRTDLASLPHDFTMQDYYFYVRNFFLRDYYSVLA